MVYYVIKVNYNKQKGAVIMQGYFAIVTIVLLVIMILIRVFLLRKNGIKAVKFGEIDKKDFIIIPFVLVFFYIVFSSALGLPKIGTELFSNRIVSWIGVVVCMLGLLLFLLSLVSFGRSFRIGIDEQKPGSLITTGIFAVSRNPIYMAFASILLGMFLIFPNWILLLYLIAGFWLLNRQVLREEDSLKKIYGKEYIKYCKKARRYL